MKKRMKHIIFDLCASIHTEKEFDDLTMAELVAAMRSRLGDVEKQGDVEAFGSVDEIEE